MLSTAVSHYVADPASARKMLAKLPEIEKQTRQRMVAEMKTGTPLPKIIREVTESVDGFSAEAKAQFFDIIDKVPMAYQKVNAIFSSPERKTPGSGGIFSIFVSDLCKGCAACVTACGDHEALKMVQETEEVNAEHETGTAFLNLLPDTSQKYLGLYNDANPADSKTATLRNMLMVRTQLRRAGLRRRRLRRLRRKERAALHRCGHRGVHASRLPRQGDRFVAKAGELEKTGVATLEALKASNPAEYDCLRQAIAHLILGLGGEDDEDTKARIAALRSRARPHHRCADWSKPSPRSCSPRPSTTRACSRSTAAWPTA